MKTLALSLLLIAAQAVGASFPIVTNPLPFLGTREKIEQWQQDHIYKYAVQIDLERGTNYQTYSYSPDVNGNLRPAIMSSMQNQLDAFIKPGDEGSLVNIWIGMLWKEILIGMKCSKGHTPVEFDSQGKVVIPDIVHEWPLNYYIYVTGLTNVQTVEIVKTNYVVIKGIQTNYVDSYFPIFTNKYLKLFVGAIDPLIIPEDMYFIFHYNHAKGWNNRYDLSSGAQTDSTIVELEMTKQNGSPLLKLCGWPGREAIVEQSSDFISWIQVGNVIFDSSGQAQVANGLNARPLFIRTKLSSP